jgi:hypothetical protein
MAFLITIGCAAVMYLWHGKMKAELVMHNGYVLLGVVALTSIGAQLFLLSSAAGDAKGFVRKFMLSTVLKMFIFLGAIMGYMLFSEESKKAVVLYFLMAYIPFTLLEVSTLYSELRKGAGRPK